MFKEYVVNLEQSLKIKHKSIANKLIVKMKWNIKILYPKLIKKRTDGT